MTIPFWCVFLAFLLIYFPRVLTVIAITRMDEAFDNRHPRDQQSRLEGWGRRANAAHLNAFEAFAPFAASVIIGHLAGADPDWSARLAVLFVVTRTLYPIFYITNLDRLRSSAWTVGFSAVLGLFLLAALAA